MAKYGSPNVGFLLVGGYSLAGYATEISPVGGSESLTERSDTVGDTWEEHTPLGQKKGMFYQTGFFDDESGGINEAMSGNGGTSRVVCVSLEGNTIGKKFVGYAGTFASKYTRIAQRGALHKANVTYTVTGEVEDGVILQELEQKTTTDWDTDAESVDNAASSANGGAGYLQVTEQAA